MIYVVNKYKHTPTENDIYIGRGSPLGNPFSHLEHTQAKHIVSSREVAINYFEQYILEELQNKNKLICDAMNKIYLMAKQGDVNLVCFCKPKSCHGDIIKNIISHKLNENNSKI